MLIELKRDPVDVRDAVRKAKEYVADTFADESIEHLGLEEVVFDEADRTWQVTVGFFRPWDRTGFPASLANVPAWRHRCLKVVHIEDDSERVVSLTHRELAAAG